MEDDPLAEQSTTAEGAQVGGVSGQGKKKSPSVRPGGPSALIGSMLSGRYRIDRLLGEGGMGAVYEAEHAHMRKRFAVKVLHPEMTAVSRRWSPASSGRRWPRPTSTTPTSPRRPTSASWRTAPSSWCSSSWRGTRLRETCWPAAGSSLGARSHVTHQIASALVRAHALGIVHRDLKPENVMLVQREEDPDFS